MAYRIRPGGSIKKNVRRIGERELEKALAAPADPDDSAARRRFTMSANAPRM